MIGLTKHMRTITHYPPPCDGAILEVAKLVADRKYRNRGWDYHDLWEIMEWLRRGERFDESGEAVGVAQQARLR